MTIIPYQPPTKYTYTTTGRNPSTIITKLIHLTGRLVENWASDVVYVANEYREAIKEHEEYDKYILFREDGVDACTLFDMEHCTHVDHIQVWHLCYSPTTQIQMLKRVAINETK